MKFTLFLRLAIFGILNFIPLLTIQWSIIILPDILETNLKIKDKTQFSFIAGYLVISYFYGRLIGSFVWPVLVRIVNKRICILISFLLMGITNALSGIGTNVYMICLCRLIAGIALNINTVGKDFLFEFCDEKYRQLGLLIDSAFCLLGGLAGPFIGYYLYYLFDKDFGTTCIAIAFFFFAGFLMFFQVFFVSYVPPLNTSHNEEELHNMLEFEGKLTSTSLRGMIYQCYKDPIIRSLILAYGITIASTDCELLLSVLYLQVPWENYGLGISSQSLSILSLICFVPSCIFLLSSYKFVPKHMQYFTFIRTILVIFTIATALTPLLRDIIPNSYHDNYNIFIFIVQGSKYIFNGFTFAPFIHYLLNKRTERNVRTIINSINFVVSTIIIIVALNVIVPLLSLSLYGSIFIEYRRYSKNIAFFIVTGLNVIALIILNKAAARRKSNI